MKVTRNYINLQRGQACFGSYNRSDSGIDSPGNLADRDRIGGFTPSSRKRLRRYLRNCDANYKVFITLTYPGGEGMDLHRVKRDLDVFFRRWKRDVPRGTYENWSACWFLEFQANGRAHIHIYSTHYLHKGWLSRNWYEIVRSDDYRHYKAGTNVKKLADRASQMRYAAKYATKSDQKLPPTDCGWIGRFWGVRGLKTTVEASTTFQEWELESEIVLKTMIFIWNILQKPAKEDRIQRKPIETERFTCVLYIWPISNDQIRIAIMPYLEIITRATND